MSDEPASPAEAARRKRLSKVTALPGCKTPDAGPNQVLIEVLRNALARAEAGELQSFIGTGFTVDGAVMTLWCPHNPNIYETLGALAWLQHEYVDRVTEKVAYGPTPELSRATKWRRLE
jgi:hypothetical protein